MKVAFVCQHLDTVLPPHQNSIGIWTYEVARLLSATDTTILARRWPGQPSSTVIDDIGVELLDCLPASFWGRASRIWGLVSPRSPLFSYRFFAIDFLLQAVRRLRRLSPDIVHIQNFPQYAPIIRKAAPKAAIVLHMHCDWLAQLDRDAMSLAVESSDMVVGCSEHVVAAARKRFPEADTIFAVLPNGAPVAQLAAMNGPRSDRLVLFVGRVSPEKGVHTLLEAWPKVSELFPDAKLDIVGPAAETPREFLVDLSDDNDVRDLSRFYRGGRCFSGSYHAALQGMIPKHLQRTITFVGAESYDQVMKRYSGASVLVNPSLSEAFGMSLVEAQAAGTPVIATRAGGMPEIIEATGGGVVVDKNDPAALADAVIRFLSDRSLSDVVGQRGAQRVSSLYSWTAIADRTKDLHEQALGHRRLKAS